MICGNNLKIGECFQMLLGLSLWSFIISIYFDSFLKVLEITRLRTRKGMNLLFNLHYFHLFLI